MLRAAYKQQRSLVIVGELEAPQARRPWESISRVSIREPIENLRICKNTEETSSVPGLSSHRIQWNSAFYDTKSFQRGTVTNPYKRGSSSFDERLGAGSPGMRKAKAACLKQR